jgi:hypothetical protein
MHYLMKSNACYLIDNVFLLWYCNYEKERLKQWWSTIPLITTKRTTTYHLTHWAWKRPRHITFDSNVLDWDSHKNVAGLNRIPTQCICIPLVVILSMQMVILFGTVTTLGWFMVFNATFNNISVISRRVSFIGGGNRSIRRKPLICRKALTNLITYCCIEYTSPWAWF